MEIGIFDKVFPRPTLGGTLDAIAGAGIHAIQFHLSSAGLPDMPDQISDEVIEQIRSEMAARKVRMAAISGTFNMIDPDAEQRRQGLQQLDNIAAACSRLAVSVITLCTGTRNPDSMWRPHPDNNTPEAWRDMLATMSKAVAIAEEHDVILAFEPEVSNVVDSATKARRLLDELQSPHLKIVMDGANIFHKGELPKMDAILDEAFDMLGNDIALAHAKDLDRDGEAGHKAAGQGLLDYDRYLALLKQSGYNGALVLHGLSEKQVPECVEFLRAKMAAVE